MGKKRSIGNVRILIERIIGVLRHKVQYYKVYFDNRLICINNVEGKGILLINLIIRVCLALVYLCLIPFHLVNLSNLFEIVAEDIRKTSTGSLHFICVHEQFNKFDGNHKDLHYSL